MIRWFFLSLKGCTKDLICCVLDTPFFVQPPLSRLKPRVLNWCFGARLAGDCILGRGMRAINWRNIQMEGGNITGEGIQFLSHGPITLGRKAMIGSDSMLISGGHNTTDLAPTSSPITLGKGVFVGARVIILEGITIGDYAMIGAGSVVTRDIPPLAIAAGNPARIISYRDSPTRIWTMPGVVDIPPEDIFRPPPEAALLKALSHERK